MPRRGKAKSQAPESPKPKIAREPFPLDLEVCGLAGPLCTVRAESSWTIREVKTEVQVLTRIPILQQGLLFGTVKLESEGARLQVALAAALAVEEPPKRLTLTMIRVEEPMCLVNAVREGQQQIALDHLGAPTCHGLNYVDDRGWTLLHIAIERGNGAVALALLAHQGFNAVNEKTAAGWTPLHLAAVTGGPKVLRAILARKDFKELFARTKGGDTAEELADKMSRREACLILREAAKEASTS